MVVSGIGRSFIYSFFSAYIFQSGELIFPESFSEFNNKASVLIQNAYGVGTFIFPVTISTLYRAYGYRTALDILAVVTSLNFWIFLLHILLKA